MIKSPESVVNVVPLLILIESFAVTIYGIVAFAVSGGFAEELRKVKESNWNFTEAMTDSSETIIFFQGLPVIILNILLIIAIIGFAIEFYKGQPPALEKALFVIPVIIGAGVPIVLFLFEKIQKLLGAAGLSQNVCDMINAGLPENRAKLDSEYFWKYLFFLGFIIVLIGCLVLLTNENVRAFVPYIITPFVLYFLLFPMLMFIIENALALGAIFGTILLIIAGLIIFIIIGSILTAPLYTDDQIKAMLAAAAAHDQNAANCGFVGRMLGVAAEERAIADSYRSMADWMMRNR